MKKYIKILMNHLRKNLNKENRKRLKNTGASIISSNCVGGVISHELGLKFLSPTVNLYIEPREFVKFCSRLDYYLEQPLIEMEGKEYPVAICGDVRLHGQHYSSFSQLNEKWEERKKRIDFDNIFFIMIERDGCTYDDIVKFDKLPYKNKVIFVSKDMPEIKSAIYIPETVTRENEEIVVSNLVEYRNFFKGTRDIDLFDYVEFLNSGKTILIK